MQWARRQWASVLAGARRRYGAFYAAPALSRRRTTKLHVLLVWLAWLASAAYSSAEAAAPERHRVVVLTPFDDEALARLRGQTVDLAWELDSVAAEPARAADACNDADADAALWLTTDGTGALRLWLFEAASGHAEARSFPLAAPGDRGARSAQREALAVSTRARLKALGARLRDDALPASAHPTRPLPAPAPRPRRVAPPPKEPAAQAEAPASNDPPHEKAAPPASDDETRAVREPVPHPTDSPADNGRAAAMEAARIQLGLGLGWAGVRTSPLPVQHGPAVEVSVAWPGAWLRASLGFQSAVAVDDAVADSRLRIGRHRLSVGLAVPIPLADRWRLVPNLEAAWLRVSRRTRETVASRSRTPRAQHDLASLRAALDAEARVWLRHPLSLWIYLSAGAEVTPARLVWRVTGEGQNTDRAVNRVGPSLRLGLRATWARAPVPR